MKRRTWNRKSPRIVPGSRCEVDHHRLPRGKSSLLDEPVFGEESVVDHLVETDPLHYVSKPEPKSRRCMRSGDHIIICCTLSDLRRCLRANVVKQPFQVGDTMGQPVLFVLHMFFVGQLVDFLDQFVLIDVDGLAANVA